jgi:hypothetical protein
MKFEEREECNWFFWSCAGISVIEMVMYGGHGNVLPIGSLVT